ncbi:MAG: type II toxin-antitoxin system VapC family toxin [Verrucomicrobiota bacterium]
MSYLLDTCVVSEAVRKIPHPKILRWIDSQNESNLYLSVITIGEIEKGVAKLSDSKKKRRIRHWLEKDLRQRFQNRILPISEEIAIQWGMIQGHAEKIGRRLPTLDSLIAATALVCDLIVVTRDTQAIEASGAKIFNPWE